MVEGVVYKDYLVRLRPLTPVHVWSGGKLMVGLDIVKRQDRLCIVDIGRLSQDLVEKILGAKPEDVYTIIENFADTLPCSEELGFSVVPPRGIQVNEIAPSFIPGSSLKGYIRTAILYVLLKDSGTPQDIRRILSSTIDLTADPRNVAQGLEGYFLRAPRSRKQGGYVDALQQLVISDPLAHIGRDCLRVEEFQVFEIPKMNRIASQYVIALACGELIYGIKVLKSPTTINNIIPQVPEHKQVLDKLSLLLGKVNTILESLRVFGCDLVRYEMEKIGDTKGLEQYRNLLNEFLKKYCKAGGECVISKLGYMAGLRSKTLIDIVKKVDRNLYNDVRNKMQSVLGHTWDELTIKLARFDGKLIGVGWCELCISS